MSDVWMSRIMTGSIVCSICVGFVNLKFIEH